MREMPECLTRRYQAMDELIEELSSTMSKHSNKSEDCSDDSTDKTCVKLMCQFWNILKEDPECNLTEAVRQRMGLQTNDNRIFRPPNIECFMASKQECCKYKNNSKKNSKKSTSDENECSSSKSISQMSTCESLNNVMCNLKEAVSFDKKCNERISELMNTQAQLQDQVKKLEEKEKDGIKMVKEAECMWKCMEDAYKKKVAESIERQNTLLKQMKEIESNCSKWRKNKKDLEFQISNINKCYQEVKEKIQEKSNDKKCIDIEIAAFKKRLDCGSTEKASVKKSLDKKRCTSNAKVASICAEMCKVKKAVQQEEKYKKGKEHEGRKYLKEAREDLQKLCRLFLQKKLETEDLTAEKDALEQEIELLKNTCDQCTSKCQNKEKTIVEEIAKLDAEITGFKVKCVKCHKSIDTADVKKCCTDCPRCVEERECLYKDGQCSPDVTMDCVCMTVKQTLMNNVLDNMYTVLERQTKSPPGKAVADVVLKCLKASINGKLNAETKKILQDYVLATVKKNLNLTIIGGAIKTRCEMDTDTYKQLMLCLDQVKVTSPPKEDKGTISKKDPCSRWGGSNECNCSKGPNSCVCSKTAPSPPKEPVQSLQPQEKVDTGEVISCPQKGKSALSGCAMRPVPNAVGTDVAPPKQASCNGKRCCPLRKNMRAAQCVLGPDSLVGPKIQSNGKLAPHNIPDVSVLEDQIICKCGTSPTKPCSCQKDTKYLQEGFQQYNENTCSTFCEIPNEVNSNNTGKKHPFFDKELNDYCKKDNKNSSTVIRVQYNNELLDVVDASVEKTGNIIVTLNLNNTKSRLSELLVNKKEQPVVLIKSSLESNNLIIESIEHSPPNALLKRTISGNIQITEFSNPLPSTGVQWTKSSREYNILKLTFNDSQIELCPPAVLKTTHSGNYIVIIDKEYETTYNKTIKQAMDPYYGCPVELSQTTSGSCMVKFVDSNENNALPNALLVRSLSGNIKIIVKKVNDYRFLVQPNTKSITHKRESYSNLFSELLSNIPTPKKQLKFFKATSVTYKKSSSESDLYKNHKLLLSNEGNLFSDVSTTIKTTSSGQYTIVLDKDSKKTFINNLKNYLSISSHDLIPIKRSEFGDITIVLNNESDSKSHYGSLKITKSGNIYLVLDETYVKNASIINELKVKIKEPTDSAKVKDHNKIRANSENKSIGILYDFCDNTECVCSEIENHTDDLINYDLKFTAKPESSIYKARSKLLENYALKKDECKRDKSPDSVIKPSSFHHQNDYKDNKQQIFYVTESICPVRSDGHDAISDESLKISERYSKGKVIDIYTKYMSCEDNYSSTVSVRQSSLDYLDYMPHQLPVFLRNY